MMKKGREVTLKLKEKHADSRPVQPPTQFSLQGRRFPVSIFRSSDLCHVCGAMLCQSQQELSEMFVLLAAVFWKTFVSWIQILDETKGWW